MKTIIYVINPVISKCEYDANTRQKVPLNICPAVNYAVMNRVLNKWIGRGAVTAFISIPTNDAILFVSPFGVMVVI
jgi:hypothetical protein